MEQTVPDSYFNSNFNLSINPNSVAPGANVELVIEVAKDAPESLTAAPHGEIATGAAARFQCWDGSTWVDTHLLLKDGFSPDSQPSAIATGPGATVTIPAVGLVIEDQPYTIVIPNVPPRVYRIEDTVIVGSSEGHIYGLIKIETG